MFHMKIALDKNEYICQVGLGDKRALNLKHVAAYNVDDYNNVMHV